MHRTFGVLLITLTLGFLLGPLAGEVRDISPSHLCQLQ
jgi:hypothetical protein